MGCFLCVFSIVVAVCSPAVWSRASHGSTEGLGDVLGGGIRGKRTLRSSLQETPRREEPKTRLQLRWSEFGISEAI